ncbi:MAG: Gfo/Idh/MocA family oxidoreductase [Treponema sp.]|jgi:predicted dehydrogenase|nr:Gfo/Idh/MocA family oxidoreductase [Treponema sp.]
MVKTQVGIVGVGGMAGYHYKGFTQAGAQVVALADMAKERAAAFAEPRGIGKIYGTLAEMLSGEQELEAVSIVTPNKFHKPLAIEALNAGKHVFCEKPPALNAAEMREMLAVAKKSGKTLMFNFNNRARPESCAMMAHIKAGRVGRINSAQASWVRRAGIPGFGGWFTNKALSGGGPVIDLLHMIDLALYFMGYPEPAHLLGVTFNDFMGKQAFKGPWGNPDVARGVCDVESAGHALLTFKTGQCLFIRTSWAEMNEREVVSVVFQGAKAGGKIERLFGRDGLDETAIDTCALYIEENGNQADVHIKTEFDETMGRVSAAANFIGVIMGKVEPLNTPEQALILMQVIDALYKSAATGGPVDFGGEK